MIELQDAMWLACSVAAEKFPEADECDFALKLKEEANELHQALKQDRPDLAIEEVADCLIVLASVIDKMEISWDVVTAAVLFKSGKNKLRKFTRQLDGTYKHALPNHLEGE